MLAAAQWPLSMLPVWFVLRQSQLVDREARSACWAEGREKAYQKTDPGPAQHKGTH